MSAIAVKIIYSERVTCREVVEKISAALPEGFEVVLEAAEFGASTAPTSESVAAELIALSEQMDKVASNMDELAIINGNEQPDRINGGTWALLPRAIELHGVADAARFWAAWMTGERS